MFLYPKCNQGLNEISHKEVIAYNFVAAKFESHILKEYSNKCNNRSKGDKASIINSKRITSLPKLIAENSFISNVIFEKYLIMFLYIGKKKYLFRT